MPPTPEQEFIAAIAHFEAGQMDAARAACERTLVLAPGHAQAMHMLGVFRHDEGRLEESAELLRAAVAAEPGHPGPRFSLGNTLMAQGFAQAAAAAFREAVERDPRHGRAWNHLAVALQDTGALEAAEQAARMAVRLLPDSAEAQGNLGLIMMRRADAEAAEAAFSQAMRLAPDKPGPPANLALLAEQANRIEDARRRVDAGLAQWPTHALFNLVAARLARRAGEIEAAITHLRQAELGDATARVRKEYEFEWGRCLDARGDHAQALHHFEGGNRLAAEAWGLTTDGPRSYLHDIEVLRQSFTPEWVRGWTQSPPGPTPAFLIGFPRSGTTLLDTLLGNAGLRVLEERPTVQTVLHAISRMPGGNPAALAGLDATGIEALRARYLDTARAAVEFDTPAALLDKSPFNISNIGLIHRIFPEAPIIMLLRHPLDVCLSCFSNDFERNAGTENFTTLTDTARLYTRLMSLWQQYKEVLDLRYMEVRYEDLVAQPESTLAAILAFLGHEGDTGSGDHTAHAHARGRIPTPSYHQVTRPVYTDSRFRWTRYASALEEVRPALEPFIEAFGYRSE